MAINGNSGKAPGKKEVAKAQKKMIQEQIGEALKEHTTRIGQKKFDSLTKKAAKSFAAAIRHAAAEKPAKRPARKAAVKKAATLPRKKAAVKKASATPAKKAAVKKNAL